MAHINEHIAGVTTAAVQLALHHSDVTLHSGGTRDYVGDSQVLTYNIRAKHRFDDHLAPQMAPAPIQATRNTPKEVLEYMKKHGMDKSQRHLAAATLKREKLEAAKAAAHEQSEQTASSTVPAPKHDLGRGKTLLFPHASEGANPRELQQNGALAENDVSSVNVTQGRVGQKKKGKVLCDNAEEEIPIDPALLALDLALDTNDVEVDEAGVQAVASLIFGFAPSMSTTLKTGRQMRSRMRKSFNT